MKTYFSYIYFNIKILCFKLSHIPQKKKKEEKDNKSYKNYKSYKSYLTRFLCSPIICDKDNKDNKDNRTPFALAFFVENTRSARAKGVRKTKDQADS